LVPAAAELLAPSIRPDRDALLFQLITLRDQIGITDRRVHQILWHGEFVIRRVAEFEKVLIARQLEKSELVSSGRFIGAPRAFKTKQAVKCDGAVEIADTDASVEKFCHGNGR